MQTNESPSPVTKSPKGGNIGRPPVMDDERLAAICLRMLEGESLRQIARDPEMPSRSTINRYIAENPAWQDRYAHAQQGLYQCWAEECLDIADDGTTDYRIKVGRNGVEYVAVDTEHIRRSEVRINTRKWLLAKLLPNTYGDKVEHEHVGDVKHTVTHDLGDREKMRRMALFMLEDQAAGVTVEGEVLPVTKSQAGVDNGSGMPSDTQPASSSMNKE